MSFVYIDLDFNDARGSYRRCCEFVTKNSIKYNLSSDVLEDLGGREKKSLYDLYESDYEWSQKGPIVISPQANCRLIFELFTRDAPLCTENFVALCNGSKGMSKNGVPLCYVGNRIHRYNESLGIIQGGDIQFGNGSGGESIWSKKFKDDPKALKLKHDKVGVLSMGNGGKNSNTSQFFITLKETGLPAADKKHCVIGNLVHGFDTLDLMKELIARAKSEKEGADSAALEEDEPPISIVITGSGEWNDTLPQRGYYDADDTFIST